MKRVKFLGLVVIVFAFSQSAYPALVSRSSAPEFFAASWINTKSRPTLESLRGKVILVAFWNYTGLQAKRDQMLLEDWYQRYQYQTAFTVIAIHSPEYPFEKDPDSIFYAVKKRRLGFPIALDPDLNLHNAYHVSKNPSYFLIDAKGRLREHFEDLSDYELVEKKIRDLLLEADLTADIPRDEKTLPKNTAEIAELKLGFLNAKNFGNLEKIQAEIVEKFQFPENQSPQKLYAEGFWKPHEQSFEFGKAGCSLKTEIPGTYLYVGAGSIKKTLIPAEVRLNGKPIPKIYQGKDLVMQEGRTYVFIKDYRLYELTKFPRRELQNQLEIILQDPGIEIFKLGSE